MLHVSQYFYCITKTDCGFGNLRKSRVIIVIALFISSESTNLFNFVICFKQLEKNKIIKLGYQK